MYTSENHEQIRRTLLDCGYKFNTTNLFPTVVPEASSIVVNDPYAFGIATCLDRGTKADVIWTIPYDIKNRLGHLDPHRIYEMSLGDLKDLFTHLPRHPRYINDAPRTLKEWTCIVVEECGGDASLVWSGRRAAEVKRTFQSIHGVGEGIANMAVLLIESAFGVRFSDLDRRKMDIKPDVHTIRVLYRLGVSDVQNERSAVEAARQLSPNYPGEIDGALWNIGRKWCRPTNPICNACCLNSVCVRRFD